MKWTKSLLPATASLAGAFLSFLPVACCVLPLSLGFLGAGMLAAGTAMMPYRPYFISATFLFLVIGFYTAYRSPKQGCDEKESCAPESGRRRARLVLWIVAVVCVLVLILPYLLPYMEI